MVTCLDGVCYWPSNKQYLYQPVASRDGRNPTGELFRAASVFHGYGNESQPSSSRVVISFSKPTLSGFRVAPRHHFNLNWVRIGFLSCFPQLIAGTFCYAHWTEHSRDISPNEVETLQVVVPLSSTICALSNLMAFLCSKH